ncbi:small subunit ribosomal protein S5 [Sporothrix brasiliensis 5110]|uniref:Small ribosomal subunit protein uS5m n=1 Tax=Sporothrix brasiliensis 5110 TaxID=1398154 RepID=A0A0C2JE40_9PEZI|nr:small subunit ribosomal protein S5 [Sporothrix brasiliensis 5110]KIH95202.1 small subunit ribosomal protein S5 [Sporothrix brasiliensis 5110]
MSFARTTAGGMLRRLAGGPETRRCTGSFSAATTTPSIHTPSPSQQAAPEPCLSAPSSSPRSVPFFVQASHFHTSAPRPARRRPRFNSVPAAELGLVDDASISEFTKKHFPDVSAEDKEVYQEKYTPAQLAALEAAEAAVDPRDLALQGRLRSTAAARVAGINYYDDFSKVQPVVDRRPRDPAAAQNVATDFTTMDDDTFIDDMEEWAMSFVADKSINWEGMSLEERVEYAEKHGPSDLDVFKYLHERPTLVHRDGKTRIRPEETGNSSMALGLPYNVPGISSEESRDATLVDPDDDGLDEAGNYTDLVHRTGLQVGEIFSLATKELAVRMVSQQTRLGKIRKFSVLAIAGNGDGRLGLGSFKSTEFTTARSKAKEAAIRNMRPIPRYEKRTIYGNVEQKISGTVVRLFSRPPGFGLRVPHHIFEMARAAGIQDLAAKIPRSRNPMNVVKATYAALMKQRDPEQIAIGRGKKLVDVRKVYFGGAVY